MAESTAEAARPPKRYVQSDLTKEHRGAASPSCEVDKYTEGREADTLPAFYLSVKRQLDTAAGTPNHLTLGPDIDISFHLLGTADQSL